MVLAIMLCLVYLFVIAAPRSSLADLLLGGEGDVNLFLNSDVSSLPSDDSFLLSDDSALLSANPDDPSMNQFSLGDAGSNIFDGAAPLTLADVENSCATDENTPVVGRMRVRDGGSSCANPDANVNLLNLPDLGTIGQKLKKLMTEPLFDFYPKKEPISPPPPVTPPEEDFSKQCDLIFTFHLCCETAKDPYRNNEIILYNEMGGCTPGTRPSLDISKSLPVNADTAIFFGVCPRWEACCRWYHVGKALSQCCNSLIT